MDNQVTKNEDLLASDTSLEGSEGKGRRSFIKGMVAGAVAAGTLSAAIDTKAAQETTNISALATDNPPSYQTQTIHVRFNKTANPVKLDDLLDAIRTTTTQTGCPTCGLNGRRIVIEVADLVEVKTYGDISLTI
jgi:hypothetical protein